MRGALRVVGGVYAGDVRTGALVLGSPVKGCFGAPTGVVDPKRRVVAGGACQLVVAHFAAKSGNRCPQKGEVSRAKGTRCVSQLVVANLGVLAEDGSTQKMPGHALGGQGVLPSQWFHVSEHH